MYLLMNKLITKTLALSAMLLLLGVFATNLSAETFSLLEDKLKNEDNAFTIMPNSSYATCNISADGAATIINQGGVEPLSFIWSTGQTTSNIFGLLPGDYGVTVTDATGCVATTVVTVMIGPEGIWLMPVSTPASCGACDGTADPMAMLGVPPYTYAWSDGQTTPIAVGLCPGEISVTVTDSQGCSNSSSVFVGSQGNLTVTATSTGSGCNDNNGTATAFPSGGMGPFTYSWSNGGTTQAITGLAPGTYTVTVTSAEGCIGVANVPVASGSSSLAGTASSTPTECGMNDGSASVNATGGTAPYTYLWSNGFTTATITNLPPAIYTVTITDSDGCTVTITVEVAGSSAPVAGTISTDDPTTICAGDGVPDPITINTDGGTQGVSLQYLVTDANGNILALPPTNVIDLEGAGPGLCLIWCLVYDDVISGVEVGNNASDIEGCFDLSNNLAVDRLSTEPATISTTDPTEFCVGDMEADLVAVTVDDPGMGVNSAWIITDADGIILSLPLLPPFDFEPTPPGNCLIWYLNYDGDLSGLEIGESALELDGCLSLSNPIEVIRNEIPTVSVTPTDVEICPGESVDFSTTPSSDDLTYEWFASAGLLSTTDQPTSTYTMTIPGTYQILVSVTSPEGCMAVTMATVTVLEGTDVTIADDPNGNTICEAGSPLTLTASSSDPNATFTWTASGGTIDPTGSQVTYNMMMPGTYTITVETTTANGCIATDMTTATVGIFEATASVSSPITNCGRADGEATVDVTGGNGNFTYAWSNGETTQTIGDLGEGDFTVTVTDVLSGCTQVSTVSVNANGFVIGNYIWLDNSEDCLQDANEQGIGGVPVNLMGPGPDGIACNSDDVIIESTNTDDSGFYEFICLEVGTYYIQFFATVVLNDVRYTCIDGDGTGNSGDPMNNDDNADSDVDPETGKTMPFEILDLDNDGLPETIDMNGDGVNDKDQFSFDAGVVEICNNVNDGGQVAGGQTLCAGETPDKIDSVTPAAGGGSAPIEYLWICSPVPGDPNPGTWTPLPNSNTDCLQLGPAFETRYYARCARREGCPEFIFESNVVCIEVVPCAQIITITTITQDDGIQVGWITSNDADGATYLVERSTDGANFTSLTEIPSVQSDLNLYNFIDESPEKGMNYYRVRRVMANGSYVFSAIAQQMFTIESGTAFGIYPNPVTNSFTLENFNIIEGDVQIEIISPSGIVRKGMQMDASSYTTEVIDTDNLAADVYYIRILHSDDQVEMIKFTKID